MGRLDIVTALRLRSGHIPLNCFAFLMRKSHSQNCTECGTREDATHIMMECIRNEADRQAFIIKHKINIFNVGTCNDILAHPLSKKAKDLYKLVNLGIKRR